MSSNKLFLPINSRIPIALGLVSLSLLLWEILLTRLYSVLLYYYFAFAVISLTIMGLAIGAAWITLSPVDKDQISTHLRRDALLTCLGMLVGILLMVKLSTFLSSIPFLWRIFLLFSISSFPCITAGKFICLVMIRGEKIGYLYAANMMGAGLACLLVGILLRMFGGPASVCIGALPAGLAFYILSEDKPWYDRSWAIGVGFVLAILLATNPGGKFQLHSGASYPDIRPLFEQWNAFSRVAVFKFPFSFNWGISPLIDNQIPPVEQLQLEVDCGSMTPLTRFDGRLEKVEYLKHDITAFAHYLRPGSKVLIIGPGGGRDILASLVFKQPEIYAAEINPTVLEAVNKKFGDFTGHLDRLPNVHFSASEGRNFVERSRDKFGIIQISLVDTWSASAAGAYAFIENGLYTIESWKSLFSHLTPGGILSLTRWYYGAEPWPIHIIRACILGKETLRQMGATSLERCIIVLRLPRVNSNQSYVGTVLLSPTPFSENDISILENQCRISGCEIAYSWKTSTDAILNLLIKAESSKDFIATSPVDISPPTDNRPYFQFFDRLFEPNDPARNRPKIISPSGQTLKYLLFIFTILSFFLAVFPGFYFFHKGFQLPNNSIFYGAYFGLIGIGFIFVELALIQRFNLFLGHPSLGFTIVLFSLLTSSAIGSFMSSKIQPSIRWFFILILLLGFFPFFGQTLHHSMYEASTAIRIIITLMSVFPVGFLLGLFLPWGLGFIKPQYAQFAGWCWTINSAMSVLGSVLGTIGLITLGEAATVWTASFLYALSGIILLYRPLDQRRSDLVSQ